ncbi:MAG: MFS transporter [Leifsonia sp.]
MTTESALATAPVEPEGAEEPRPLVTGTLKRLTGWSIPANISIFMLWGAVPGLLLPLQVTALDPANKLANLTVITTVGAFLAMLAQPIAGAVSDRTRSRFGRRAPWLVAGALAGALALIGLAVSNTVFWIAVAWAAVQISYNFAQGPLSAVLPDRVPRKSPGTFASLVGMASMVGAVGGSVVGAAFAANIPAGYLFFAGFALIALTLFVVFNPDHSSADMPKEPFGFGDFLRTFWVSPIKHPDFFWAFTGRLLLYTGYFAVTGFQLFILQDYIGLGDDAIALVPVFSLVSLAGIIVGTLICGPLSDRFARRKVFVFISSVVVGVAFLVPVFIPTTAGWFIFTVLAGLGFGAFQSVDQALMSEVLPSKKSFAKDLGVVNIAATLPQTLAPAVGGAIALAFGYVGLFPVGIVLSVAGAFAVWFIKAVR